MGVKYQFNCQVNVQDNDHDNFEVNDPFISQILVLSTVNNCYHFNVNYPDIYFQIKYINY